MRIDMESFFGAIIKTQPEFSKGLKARLICKIFLLTIFSNSYFRHREHTDILNFFGLEVHQYSISSIKKVNQAIRNSVPVVLDLENSLFFEKLDHCVNHMSENEKINQSNQHIFLKFMRKIPHYFSLLRILLSLLFVKSIDTQAGRTV